MSLSILTRSNLKERVNDTPTKLSLEAVLRLFSRFLSLRSTVWSPLFRYSFRPFEMGKTAKMRTVQGVASTHEEAYLDVRD